MHGGSKFEEYNESFFLYEVHYNNERTIARWFEGKVWKWKFWILHSVERTGFTQKVTQFDFFESMTEITMIVTEIKYHYDATNI
jgi:hypothetical protein